MKIEFIASVSLISADSGTTRGLLTRAFGLPLAAGSADPDYVFSERIGGSKHFGVWPLAQAAEACFGSATWPRDLPVPQVSIEFEVASDRAVAEAEAELRAQGVRLLHATRKEPWGQTVCRLLSGEGAILGVSFAPWLHDKTAENG
ncbi:MAG TPA: glyoxalase [Polyangia bacterium]|nr:glyoxalase [Polyangia bacterium]